MNSNVSSIIALGIPLHAPRHLDPDLTTQLGTSTLLGMTRLRRLSVLLAVVGLLCAGSTFGSVPGATLEGASTSGMSGYFVTTSIEGRDSISPPRVSTLLTASANLARTLATEVSCVPERLAAVLFEPPARYLSHCAFLC